MTGGDTLEYIESKTSAQTAQEQKQVDNLTHRPDQNVKSELTSVAEVIDSLP